MFLVLRRPFVIWPFFVSTQNIYEKIGKNSVIYVYMCRFVVEVKNLVLYVELFLLISVLRNCISTQCTILTTVLYGVSILNVLLLNYHVQSDVD